MQCNKKKKAAKNVGVCDGCIHLFSCSIQGSKSCCLLLFAGFKYRHVLLDHAEGIPA